MMYATTTRYSDEYGTSDVDYHPACGEWVRIEPPESDEHVEDEDPPVVETPAADRPSFARRRWLRTLALAVCVALAAIPHTPAELSAAPAPFPRVRHRPRDDPPPAACVMLWDGMAYTAAFRPGGRYECCGWEGGWALSWPHLYLWERPAGEYDRPFDHYQIKLDSRWKGVFVHGRAGTFELRPR